MPHTTALLAASLGPAHTPGPWHSERNSAGNIEVWATRSGDDDKLIIGVSQFGPMEVREANARLIAAAPDLLDALKQVDEILRHNPDASEPPAYRNARAAKIVKAAIAKAEAH